MSGAPTIHLLGYSQIVLLLWCPLAVLLMWKATVRLRRNLPGHINVFLALGASLTPCAALFVPYIPQFPIPQWVFWRPTIMWGLGIVETTFPPLQVIFGFGPILILLSIFLSFSFGIFQALRTNHIARRVKGSSRMASFHGHPVWIVEDHIHPWGTSVACTVGLVSPQLFILQSAWESAHREPILIHELSHVRFHDPLLIWLSTCSTRAFWWIPGLKKLSGGIRLDCELAADHNTRMAIGSRRLAEALLFGINTGTGEPMMAGTAFRDDCHLLARARAISQPMQRHVSRFHQMVALGIGLLFFMLIIIYL